jgi:hypothetical protein
VLYALAGRLLAQDDRNQMVKKFFQVQLGSCQHALLHKCLGRIISGEIYTAAGVSRLDEIQASGSVFLQLSHCLVPVPIDPETHALVCRAKISLEEAYAIIWISETDNFTTRMNDEHKLFQFQFAKSVIDTMERWQDLHDQSDEVRWNKTLSVIRRCTSTTEGERWVMEFRKSAKNAFKTKANINDGEMCACCFVLEKSLLDESSQKKRLMTCSRW